MHNTVNNNSFKLKKTIHIQVLSHALAGTKSTTTFHLPPIYLPSMLVAGVVAQWLRHRTCNQLVAGSSQVVHSRASAHQAV